MGQRIINAVIFLVAFMFGLTFIDHVSAQGVAAAVSLWLNGSYVSTSNPLPVHNQ